MTAVQAPVVIRRFDPDRDAQSLRSCLIEHQDLHQTIEPSWADGDAVVEEYLAYLEGECVAYDGCILIADVGDRTAGFVCVAAAANGAAPDDPGPFAWIYDIFVKPPYRRQRVASLLMEAAETFARSRGALTLRLAVQARNQPAREFYQRHAFREYTHVLTKALA
jgi:GNAT superfamily N-acetyltransferase